MHKALIIVLVVVALSFNLAVCSDEKYALHKKLYSEERFLRPSETLGILKTLDNEFKPENGVESSNEHKDIVQLLNAGEITEDKCLSFYMEYMILQELLLANSNFPNIVDYLEYNKDALFSICKQSLLNKLKEDVEKLPEYIEGFFGLLINSMLEADTDNKLENSRFLIPYEDILKKGIIGFLEKTSGPLIPRVLDEDEGRMFFEREYDSSIRKPCYIVKKQIQSIMTDFYTLSHDENMLKKFDPFAVLWLENFNACMSIVGRGKAYSIGLGKKAYQYLVANAEELSKQTVRESKEKRSIWHALRS